MKGRMVSDTTRARTLLAAVVLAEQGERLTVRAIASATGRSVGQTHEALRQLRDLGLVGWEDGKHATLHLTCFRVEVAA